MERLQEWNIPTAALPSTAGALAQTHPFRQFWPRFQHTLSCIQCAKGPGCQLEPHPCSRCLPKVCRYRGRRVSIRDPWGDTVSPMPLQAQCTHPTTRLHSGATWASGPPSGREKAWGTLERGQRGSEVMSAEPALAPVQSSLLIPAWMLLPSGLTAELGSLLLPWLPSSHP